MICADFMLVNCRGVQQCSMQQDSAELAEQKKKNKVWLISTFTGWLESEELFVFSISASFKLFQVWVIMPVTLCYLTDNSIMALVDLKWSPLHPVFVWHLTVAPSPVHDAPVATNQFPTLSNELRFCISSLDLNFVPWSLSKQESRIIANFTL